MVSAAPTADNANVDSGTALIAIVAAGTVGEVLLYIVPILLGAVADSFAVQEGTAGLIMSLEIAVAAGAALALTGVIHRISCKPFAVIAVFIIFAGDLASAFSPSFGLFIVARLVAALGAGAIFAAASAMAAQRKNPEKTFAILSFAVIVAATIGYIAITAAIERFGPQSSFAALALLSLAALPALAWFPNSVRRDVEKKPIKLSRKQSMLALASLGAIFILYIGQNGLWAYVERIGASLEIPLPVISQILVINGAVSLIGPALAHWLNIRFGRKLPLFLAFAVQILMSLFLVYATSLPAYAISVVILTAAFMFSIPYLKGLMAAIDPSGRVTGASAAIVTVGAAAGPGIAGAGLNAGATYIAIGWFAATAAAITAALSIGAAYFINRNQTR